MLCKKAQKKDAIKQTFSISEGVVNRLDQIHTYYRINKATFMRMAIYHGIKLLGNGYKPIKRIPKQQKKKISVTLSFELYEKFTEAKKKLDDDMQRIHETLKQSDKKTKLTEAEKILEQMTAYKNQSYLSYGELVECFLRIELKKYSILTYALIYDRSNKVDTDGILLMETVPSSDEKGVVIKDHFFDDERLLEESEQRHVDFEIPRILLDKINHIQNRTGLKESQLYKYYLIRGMVEECINMDFDMINTDTDVNINIFALGLPHLKTMTLLNNLIRSGKMIMTVDRETMEWMSENNSDSEE